MPFLDWAMASHSDFLPFQDAELSTAPNSGVYVIVDRVAGSTLKIGFGDVAALLAADRDDDVICRNKAALQVTWAAALPQHLPGITRSLSEKLNPAIRSETFATSLEVNVPGSPVVA